MRLTASLFLCLLLSSCASILNTVLKLNDNNDYAELTIAEKSNVKPYGQSLKPSSFQKDTLLYEIDSIDIKTITTSEELVWIHLWRPFCNAKSCQIITPFAAKAKKHNVELFMVSETYNFNDLNKIAKESNFTLPIYVVKGNTFGHNIDKSRKLFLKSLAKNQFIQPAKFASDFLFKNGKLIYANDFLIDSLDRVLEKN
jgi:hypothetical protein